MNRVIPCLLAFAVSGVVLAQADTTVKQGAHATSQKAQQYADQAKAATESQPDRSIDRAKARVHKAKAHHHARRAKHAAKNTPPG